MVLVPYPLSWLEAELPCAWLIADAPGIGRAAFSAFSAQHKQKKVITVLFK